MKSFKLRFAFALAAAFAIFSTRSAVAANYTVTMSGTAFTPATLTIGVGDRVTWTNTSVGLGSTHTATRGDTFCGTNGLGATFWNSGDIVSHATYSFTFTNFAAGTYTYLCLPHCANFNMKGTIILTNAPNVLPTVNITNPVSGTVFSAPASVTIQASASDSDGSITNVQFLVGSTVLTNDNFAPYVVTTNGLPAGSYSLRAVAADNRGGKATNSINIVVNGPPSISLTNPAPGAAFVAPASITLSAQASDEGTVTNVQLLSGGALVASLVGQPYSFTLNNLAAGNYSFTAAAWDNFGAASTSSVVNIFVLTNAMLSEPITSGGQFHLTITGIAGQTYTTEASTNLLNWEAVATNVAPANIFNLTDTASTNVLQRFYRARQSF